MLLTCKESDGEGKLAQASRAKKAHFEADARGAAQFCRQRTVCSRPQCEGQLATRAVPTSRFLLPSNHPPIPDFSTSSSSVAHGEWHSHSLLLLPQPVVVYLEMTRRHVWGSSSSLCKWMTHVDHKDRVGDRRCL